MKICLISIFKVVLLTFFLMALFGKGEGGIASVQAKPLGTIINGNPSNYLTELNNLSAGDTLLLDAGTYENGLSINNKHGTAANPIIIAGPESGSRAVFKARSCCNTVSINNSSYIEIRNLELDGHDTGGSKVAGVDAVKAESNPNPSHHITLENLYIHDHDLDQQMVGISTKATAWDWVIRNNIIESTGTGMYLGDSNGSAHFINGLIEGNLFLDTIGYNVQIKHQTGTRSGVAPASGTTVIRHNVFSKANNASTGGNARPNLLVGHWPLSGNGINDEYQIYGNFFYQNPSGEPLFQGEGNIALYDNLFVNNNGDAIWIQPHNDVPKMIRVFNNTVVASNLGIRVTGGDISFEQKVIGNAVFAAIPINAADQTDNVTDSFANAGTYVVNPTGTPPLLDLYPNPGMLTGSALDNSSFNTFQDWDRDFNSTQHDGTYRGAYQGGAGSNPGWLPKLERKPLGDIQISGTVTEGGNGLSGVSFSSSGAGCQASNSSGDYTCFVVSGWDGTITPMRIGYIFTPTLMTYTNVTTHMTGQDYIAENTLTNMVYLPIIVKE